ncbi:unnamed protein product [Arabidopsis halleri]
MEEIGKREKVADLCPIRTAPTERLGWERRGRGEEPGSVVGDPISPPSVHQFLLKLM